MSADIGPGDFVECIDDSLDFTGCRPFLAGSIYVVTCVYPPGGIDLRTGKTSSGSVDIKGVPGPRPDVSWEVSRFRPTYRPKPDAFTDLLKVPDRKREKA